MARPGKSSVRTRLGATLSRAPSSDLDGCTTLSGDPLVNAPSVDWLLLSGSANQLQEEVRALVGAHCATATAATAAGKQLGNPVAVQWQRQGGATGRLEQPVTARALAAGADLGHADQAHVKHASSGIWLPLWWVMQLCGMEHAAPHAAAAAAGARGDVIMADAQAAVDELRARPDYGELLERAVAMEIDYCCGAAVGGGAAGGGAVDAYGSGQQQHGTSGPAPHPLSPHPHSGGHLPVPRVLLVVDTNILLDAKG